MGIDDQEVDLRMFNHLKEMMEKQREKAATDSEETTQKFGHLEEELRKQQEEERQRLADRRGEERREAEAERERAAREAELVVERMETRVAAVQDDVKQRQLQVAYLQMYIRSSTSQSMRMHLARVSRRHRRWRRGWRR